MTSSRNPETEVLIVGGGPAGLAAAIAARLAGLEVDVLDSGAPPLDKACGEGLMPDGVRRLRDLGVELDERLGIPFRGIRYLDGSCSVEGSFPGRPGLGIRRTRLHERLARRAAALGARLRWGVRAAALLPQGLDTDEGPIRARWLVGADGLHSSLRRWAGLDRGTGRFLRFGVSRHYAAVPWTDMVEVYWADGVEAYVTPLGSEEVGVTLLWDGDGRAFDALIAGFPTLLRRLADAPACSADRGAGPLHRKVRAVHTDRLALVGDASGYLDAITGEGLSLAFHHAFALAEAIGRGDLSLYGAAHRRLAEAPARVTRRLLMIERHPWARQRLIRALARDPDLFSRYLAVMCREADPGSGAHATTVGLVRRLAGL